MEIRNFRPGDLGTLARFKQESARTSFPGRKYNIELFRRRVLEHSKKFPGTIKVAEDRGKIAGYIWFSVKKTSRGRFGVVRHVFIEPSHRRHGLATELNRAAEDWFRSQGISWIEVTITKTNRPSLEMCRRLGYKETRLVLEKSLKK